MPTRISRSLSAPSARRAPPLYSTEARNGRSGPARRRRRPCPASVTLAVFLRQARDAAALAPAAVRRRVDLPRPWTGARENPRWDCQRSQGALLRLGVQVAASAIRTTLCRHGLDPVPRRPTTTWAGVPAPAGRRDRRLRLLHRRHHLASSLPSASRATSGPADFGCRPTAVDERSRRQPDALPAPGRRRATTAECGHRIPITQGSCREAGRSRGQPTDSQVAFRGVAGDRRHGMSAQDVVSCATSFVPVVVEPAGWPAAVTRAMEDSDT